MKLLQHRKRTLFTWSNNKITNSVMVTHKRSRFSAFTHNKQETAGLKAITVIVKTYCYCFLRLNAELEIQSDVQREISKTFRNPRRSNF